MELSEEIHVINIAIPQHSSTDSHFAKILGSASKTRGQTESIPVPDVARTVLRKRSEQRARLNHMTSRGRTYIAAGPEVGVAARKRSDLP